MRFAMTWVALILIVAAFGIGVNMGWDSGRRDANQFNSEGCNVR